jgi:hypothetical protein
LLRIHDLMPREHGTWAMWIVPMLSAALVTHFSLSFILLFISFALLFISHRPIVTLMRKKANPNRRIKEDARKSISIILPPALILSCLLLIVYDLPWLIMFGMLELGLFIFSIKTFVDNEQRSLVNELTVIFALTLTAPAAYYTITRNLDLRAVQLYLLNFLFFGSSLFYLKTKIEFLRSKGEESNDYKKSLIAAVLYHFLLVAVIIVLSITGTVNILMLFGFVPMTIQSFGGIVSKRKKVNFTRIGIALIAQSSVFLFALKVFWK